MQRLVQLALDFLGGGSSPDSEVPQPKRAMAPIAYSEQLGMKRQRGPSSGLMNRLYRRSLCLCPR